MVEINLLMLALNCIHSVYFGMLGYIQMIFTLVYRYYLHMGVDGEMWDVVDDEGWVVGLLFSSSPPLSVSVSLDVSSRPSLEQSL